MIYIKKEISKDIFLVKDLSLADLGIIDEKVFTKKELLLLFMNMPQFIDEEDI